MFELRILGIDPGTFKMGVGLIDSDGDALTLIQSDVLTPSESDALPLRLHHLHRSLLDLIEQYRPSVVAVEDPFVAKNARAALAIGQAQAVAMIAASHHGLETFTYVPTQVKRAVTDYGASTKDQVQAMVKVLLGLPDDWQSPPDAADALAVSICHAAESRASGVIFRE